MPLSNQARKQNPLLGTTVRRATNTLPQTATGTIFTVTGGPVVLTGLTLIFTTAVQAQATVIKFRHTPTGGSVADISGTVDVNGAPVGGGVDLQGPTTAGALTQAPLLFTATGGAVGKTLALGTGAILLQPGALGLNAAASSTGAFRAILTYTPLDGTGVVSAA